MFEKKKAKIIYQQMLMFAENRRRIMQNSEEYHGDKGMATISADEVNDKLRNHLFLLATKDCYNFGEQRCQSASSGREMILFTIDNEPKEYKKEREEKMRMYVDAIIEKMAEANDEPEEEKRPLCYKPYK